jgi:hypothetical protein
MTNIDVSISVLKPNGAELFSDSESFMGELSESELASTKGGNPYYNVGKSLGQIVGSAGVVIAFSINHLINRDNKL